MLSIIEHARKHCKKHKLQTPYAVEFVDLLLDGYTRQEAMGKLGNTPEIYKTTFTNWADWHLFFENKKYYNKYKTEAAYDKAQK